MGDIGAIIGSAMAAVSVGGAIVWRSWSKLRAVTAADATNTASLRLINEAVVQWQIVYEMSQRELAKEREFRNKLELKVQHLQDEIHELRGKIGQRRATDH